MPRKKQFNPESLYFPNRIVETMNAFLGYPLTIVEAPMGYGKTTFVRESLKKNEADVLWQKVFDNSIAGFWKGFCLQLGEVDHDRAVSLAALGFPSDSTTRYEAMSLIETMKLQKDTVLVIDDYHLVACPPINVVRRCSLKFLRNAPEKSRQRITLRCWLWLLNFIPITKQVISRKLSKSF